MRLSLLLMVRIIAFFFLIVAIGFSAIGQGDFSIHGSLHITNYSPKDYKANPQVFSISQSEEGIMYFANQRGVLEYDGETWETHMLSDKAESLNLINSTRFLVTSTSGLGELVADENGVLVYEDRNAGLPESIIDLYNVVRYENQYLVSTFEEVFVLDEELTLVNTYTNADGSIVDVTVLSDGVYFTGVGNDIVKYDGTGFETIIKNPLGMDNPIVSIFEFNGEKLFLSQNGMLFGTYEGSLYEVYSNDEISIKNVIAIDNKYISIGTYVDGIIILNKKMDPVYRITPDKGLIDGTVLCQFVDAEKNLWLGTSNGIAKVDLMSPVITFQNLFDQATIEALTYTDDRLVMATGGGAYELRTNGEIIKIEGINDDCYGLDYIQLPNDTSVYISALFDLFKYDGGEAVSIAQGGPYNARVSPLNENQLVVLHYDGIQLLDYNQGEFVEVAYVSGFSGGEPFNFVIEDNGDIWIGTKPNDGVYKINVSELTSPEPNFQRFYTDEGLPIGQTYMFSHDDKMYCATDFGMYRLDQGQFQMTTEFGVDFKETKQGVHRINADPNGNVWMVLFEDMENTYEIGYSAKSEGYVWHSEYFSGYDEYIAHAVFHQDANVTWIGGPGGLMSFDKRRVSDHAVEFNALIRSVNFGGEVLFGGSGLPRDNYELAFESKHKIEFSFAANTFKSEDKTQYSWMLEGFDEDWSAWSSMTKDDYSLQEGTYTFKVRAKNAKGEISEEAAFTFTILPPWYRTWWAYMLFVVVLILVVYALIRLSIHRVKQQNIKLEKIVEDRTQEVVAQKAEVEKQRDIAEHQKHLVEEKNLEILDSINYAKRLQNAILTPVKTIYDTFQESFILYLPKDIVAGDFYWTNLAKLNKRDSRNMIAAADCTGHGVPGAMVSVVCSNALDRSVKEFGLTQPAEVLDKVTDLVIETFEKSEDEVKDGMDIALCAFEEKEDHVELQYAGANNNLWIISEKKEMSVNQEHLEPVLEMEGMNLFEVKATKQPVGKYLDRKPFINNVVKLNQGDTIYLFTDGFADQFGGPKGKKYKYLPFKRFLISMQNKGLQDQMTGLSDEFYRWKGDIEQIDDVCVIGIRV